MTLNDYANERENVVLFWASGGTPGGEYAPLGNPDLDFADRRGLLNMNGDVDDSGDWRWDGEGNPADDNANSITKLHAYVDAKLWATMSDRDE
jgi:hypothetical protein